MCLTYATYLYDDIHKIRATVLQPHVFSGRQKQGLAINISWSDFLLCHQCEGQSHCCDVTSVHYEGLNSYFHSSTVTYLKYNVKYYVYFTNEKYLIWDTACVLE